MTEKQKKFLDYYVINNDTCLAAALACCTAGTGRKWLKMPESQAYLDAVRAETNTAKILSRDDVLIQISKIAKSPSTRDKDKLRALELLGKYYALFTEKQVVDVGENTITRLEGMTLEKRKERINELVAGFCDGSE